VAQRSSFVVVANRLPVDSETDEDGTTRWSRSPGGLVTALEPIMRRQEGVWVGWSGNPDETHRQFAFEGINLYPVPLSSEEVARYYEGFSNATLWPLYHDAVAPPAFHRTWWEAYVKINWRFAEAAAQASAEGGVVWIQDYQLQLVPAMLREKRPDLKIGFFLHIPFPPQELFHQLPWRTRIVDGLLGADLVGFQRPMGAQNFLRLARTLAGRRTHGSAVIDVDGRTVQVKAFPISIDASSLDELATTDRVSKRAREIRAELGDPEHVLLGVDRLDYTKGIDVRLRAFREMLEDGRVDVPQTVMVQVATPSRERVEHYRVLREHIEREIGGINGDYGKVGLPAVHYLHQSYSREELAALYCAADVMVVTPFRDGMNLVAKEYVACRRDETGALVLSEFTGAAAELKQAFLVNPHDIEGIKEALHSAMTKAPEELRRRMRAMRSQVFSHDVDHWARGFLYALGAA
jgi:trehalose 6-phosphate synthase